MLCAEQFDMLDAGRRLALAVCRIYDLFPAAYSWIWRRSFGSKDRLGGAAGTRPSPAGITNLITNLNCSPSSAPPWGFGRVAA